MCDGKCRTALRRMRMLRIVTVMVAATVVSSAMALGQTQPASRGALPQVLCLDAHQPEKIQYRQSLLVRELVRQAVLVAAREELGLATRDAALREPFPAGARVLDVEVSTAEAGEFRSTLVERDAPGNAGAKVLWQRTMTVQGPYKDLLPALVAASGPSLFAELAKALTDAGFAPARARAGAGAGADVAPSAEREQRIADLNYFAQFAVLRELHGALRDGDESSPVALGGLVRAYANLGQLTQLQWSAAHQTFKARALLYAQRMTAAQPDAPGPLWHRAYGWTMAGAHAEAIKDLARAAELAKATKAEPPSWVPLIDAACRYDTTHLLDASADADAPTAPLAAYLAFLTLENSPSVNVHRKFAEAAMQFNPSCLRPIDALVEVGGVSELHALTLSAPEIFKRSIFQDLPKMPGLPNEVKDALAKAQQNANDPKSRADIAGALVAAGDPAHDAAEPSWAILGRTMQGTFFAQTHRRTHFMAFSWGLDQQEVWDFAQLAKALVGDHPYMPILEAYGSWSDWPKAVKLLGAVGLRDVNLGMLPLARLVGKAKETRIRAISPWQWMTANRDVTAIDLERLIRAYQGSDSHDSFRLELTRELHEISPHSPIAIGALIEDDWEGSQPKLAQWERDYTNHPAISAALARQYAQQGKTDDAKRMWKAALAVSPDWDSYRALAGLYLREGDEAQWLATMETALAGEPHGLSDAVLRVDIAEHFMAKGDFRRALPYATAAAETWAGWAMWCASHCYEGLEDWPNAELWARRVAERYESSGSDWYIFCRRTGKGDERAALAMARQYLQRVGVPGNADASRYAGMIDLLAGEDRAAAKLFATGLSQFKDADSGMLAALTLDAAGDAAARDAAWDALLALRETIENPQEWRQFFELVTLFKQHSAGAGLKDAAEVEAHLAGNPQTPPKAYYWAGRFFQTRGNVDAAMAAYARCAMSSTGLNRTLASAQLRDLGVEPRDLKRTTTQPATAPE